jgi:hypothetical protein
MYFVRGVALLAVLAFSIVVTGCSGGGGGATPPVPLTNQDGSVPASDSTPTDSTGTDSTVASPGVGTLSTVAAPASGWNMHVQGKIVAIISSSEFSIYAGSSVGNLHVYTTSSTTKNYNGLTPKVGVYADVYGNGSAGTYITAVQLTLSSTSTFTTTTTTTTTPTATTSSSVPKHVQTAEYLYSSTEKTTSPATYAPYLTWAYAATGRYGVTQSAGIKTVIYTNLVMPESPSWEYSSISNSYSTVRARNCSGSVITTYGGKGYLQDPRTSSAGSYASSVIKYYVNSVLSANSGYSHPYNLVFVDNAGPLYGASSTPCNYTASTWGSYLDSSLAASGQPVILNTLSTSISNVSTYVQRLKGSNIVGGEYEHCYSDNQWTPEEQAQIQAIALVKSQGKAPGAGFWCYLNGTNASAASSTTLRMFAYASFLLTYDPNYSVFQESFTTPSTFKVMPETGFVPLSPMTTASSITSLLSSSGVYVRRYSSCYYRGVLKGQCEIAVNPTTLTRSVPNPAGLKHRMVISGYGVLDGGTVSFTGTAATSLAPKTAEILLP